jgi:pimeloyl-ACP methyl ester carboxylesterase
MRNHVEVLIGVLNGAVGDYLKRTGNGLATPMELIHDGRPLPVTRDALAAAHPGATHRAVVLVHGLMSTEDVFFLPDGETYATLLARDLGYTPYAVRYNSGLHISENGEALDDLLERLVLAHPVPLTEIALVGHSMGGLVVRSAAHAASARDRRWLPIATSAFYLGSPHLGAPLERFGNVLAWTLGRIPNPVTELVADLINLRSSGVKDLRYGSLRHEDWMGEDADALLQNRRHPVPLLPHVRHHLVAATLTSDPALSALFFGDALVPLPSATGRARPRHRSAPFPQDHVRVLPALDHLSLAHHPQVYAVLRAWIEGEETRCSVTEASGP